MPCSHPASETLALAQFRVLRSEIEADATDPVQFKPVLARAGGVDVDRTR